jgi:hypothetical protein
MRPTFAVLLGLAGLAAGFVMHSVWPRDARAQAGPSTASIYVPSDGLVFRGLDDRPLARLSRGPNGGMLELYDDRERAFRAVAVRTLAPGELRPNPYDRAARHDDVADDLEDPFAPRR